MPRLVPKLPSSLTGAVVAGFVALAAVCGLTALIFFLVYLQTTETSGQLWWKETREIPYSERRPYLLACIGFGVVSATSLIGAVKLAVQLAKQSHAERLVRQRWEQSPEGQAHRQAEAAAAQQRWAAAAAARAERDAAEARRLWEASTAGRAAIAYQRGDHYFSLELKVDGDLAEHLNAVSMAGWRQESVGKRHEKSTSAQPLRDGTHEVTRETIEYRTYLFRRAN
jgi:hypothetical protein